MKTIYKISCITVIALVASGYSTVNAQEFKSGESIKEQLKKGNVAGLKYGTANPQNNKVNDDKPKQYTKENFRSLIFQNYSQSSRSISTPTNVTTKTAKSISGSAKLPSDAEVQKPNDKDKKVETFKLPTQGEEKKKE